MSLMISRKFTIISENKIVALCLIELIQHLFEMKSLSHHYYIFYFLIFYLQLAILYCMAKIKHNIWVFTVLL